VNYRALLQSNYRALLWEWFVTFRKFDTNYRALLRKMKYSDKAFWDRASYVVLHHPVPWVQACAMFVRAMFVCAT